MTPAATPDGQTANPPDPRQPDGGHDSFPRLAARTQRFTLGEPRAVTVADDGGTVLFLRTASGTDRTGMLWAYDVATGVERVLADPAALVGAPAENLSAQERARRERAREAGSGIVAYSVDKGGTTAVFTLSGTLWVCDVASGACRPLTTPGSVIDPRVDPTGASVAYCSDGALRLTGVDGRGDRALAEPDGEAVVWGQAEFIAAEEMGRYRGFWWAPDGSALLAERYDESPVGVWHIADPAHPEREPVSHRYPAAGTANAEVSLWYITLEGRRHEIAWDTEAFPYLTAVHWGAGGAVFEVLSRDQRSAQIYRVTDTGSEAGADTGSEAGADTSSGAGAGTGARAERLAVRTDPAWVDIVGGLPALTPDGRLLTCIAEGDDPAASTARLAVNGVAVSPVGLQLVRVLSVTDAGVVATVTDDPTHQHLVRLDYDGGVEYLSRGDGIHGGAVAGDTVVVTSSRLDTVGASTEIRRARVVIGVLENHVVTPPFRPNVTMLTVGERRLRAALVLPRHHVPGSAQLPVIMAPYGGPHAHLVRASGRMFLQAQWMADQGFAVVVADGRGSPGRGPAWERTIKNKFAEVTLADQVDALAGVAARFPDDLDTGRVGISGWSYGGYLAALAVLDRPDVFHAAVAGAPVTDWSLYDTCYTERYLGDPNKQPEVYRQNSLIDRAGRLTRPLLLIHGLVDDNVVVAHTLRLSAALLAAGREHQVLPLTGVTHMASAEEIAENLLLAQVRFLRHALGAPTVSRRS